MKKGAQVLLLKKLDNGECHVEVTMEKEAVHLFDITADVTCRGGKNQTLVWNNILVRDPGDFVFLPQAVQEKYHLLVVVSN